MAKPIEETPVFQLFEDLADRVWNIVASWTPFARDTIGKQLARSIDSVGANMSEGDGRHYPAEGLRFLYVARGSAYESRTWLQRATRRSLLPDDGPALCRELESAIKQLNSLIGYRRQFVSQPKREAQRTTEVPSDSRL